ncbi:MAG: PilZ domain-containing protein [Candidatus Cloacimonetes bacterium]|nr:PilZ domain-containing protein [Candidatus Cloacimonadota bacterium]
MTAQDRPKRENLTFYPRVFDAKDKKELGSLADMNLQGMKIFGIRPLPLDKTYQLRINLPVKMAGNEFMIIVARTLWGKEDVNPDYWATGFQFTEVSEKNERIIRRLIEDYNFVNEYQQEMK